MITASTDPSACEIVPATGIVTLNGRPVEPASRVAVSTVKNGVTTTWKLPESYSEYVPLNTSMISTYGLVLFINPLFIR